MSIWSGFFGGRRNEDDRFNRNNNIASGGQADRTRAVNESSNRAIGYIQPYAEGGRRGYDAYQNMLGLNGGGAQRDAQTAYSGYNPYLTDQMTAATRAQDRRAAATGGFGSGLNALAGTRMRTEMGSQDLANYMSQLASLGNQGYGASTGMAGIEQGRGNAISGIIGDSINQRIGNSNQYAAGLTAADRGAAQNVLGLGAMALGAMGGFPGMGSMLGRAAGSAAAGATGGSFLGSLGGLGGSALMNNWGNVGQSSVGPGGLPQLGGGNNFFSLLGGMR